MSKPKIDINATGGRMLFLGDGGELGQQRLSSAFVSKQGSGVVTSKSRMSRSSSHESKRNLIRTLSGRKLAQQ